MSEKNKVFYAFLFVVLAASIFGVASSVIARARKEALAVKEKKDNTNDASAPISWQDQYVKAGNSLPQDGQINKTAVELETQAVQEQWGDMEIIR